MTKNYVWFMLFVFGVFEVSAQVYNGVYKSPTTNMDYHHFRRDGSGAAVYINQISSNSAHPILRLSSGTADANSAGNVRFTVENNGYVGLGTTTPLSKLHLYNGASGGSSHGYSDLTVEDDDHGMISILTPNDKVGFFGFADTNDDFVGGIQYEHTANRMMFRVNNRSSDMIIDNLGRVGIGTTTPGKKLDVLGEIRSLDGSDRMGLKVNEANSVSEIHWGDDTNDRLRFYYNYWNGTANDKEVMTLLANGNVGIGTANPDSELAVKGQIHAQEVKVDLDGAVAPDYVFDEGYNLRSLEEVQEYINAHGHLPNIPSAKEMEENGLMLKEMNLKLLEKIEELTLYVLQQREVLNSTILQLEQVKENNDNLKQHLKNLKNRKK